MRKSARPIPEPPPPPPAFDLNETVTVIRQTLRGDIERIAFEIAESAKDKAVSRSSELAGVALGDAVIPLGNRIHSLESAGDLFRQQLREVGTRIEGVVPALEGEFPRLMETWLQGVRPLSLSAPAPAPAPAPGEEPVPGEIEVPGLLWPYGETEFQFLYRQLLNLQTEMEEIGEGGGGDLGGDIISTEENVFFELNTFNGPTIFNDPVTINDTLTLTGLLSLTVNDTNSAGVSVPATIRHTHSAGAGATFIGVGLDWSVESTTSGVNIGIGRTQFVALDATTGAFAGAFDVQVAKATVLGTYFSVVPDIVAVPFNPLLAASTTPAFRIGAFINPFSGSGSGIAIALAMPAGFVGDFLNAQVNGTERYKILGTGQSFQTGPLTGGLVTTISGVVNIGDGGFSGAGGEFAGGALGTYLAVNSITGFTGDVIEAQVGGKTLFRVSGTGQHTFQVRDTAATGPSAALRLQHRLSSGTAAVFMGVGLEFAADNNVGAIATQAIVRSEASDTTAGAVVADLVFLTSNGGSFPERMRIKAGGSINADGPVQSTGGFLAGATTGKGAVVDIARAAISAPTQAEINLLRVVGAADTLVDGSANAFCDVAFDLTRTVQFDGPDTIASAHHVQITPGTFSADAAVTAGFAASLFVNGSPIAGTNMTFTERICAYFNGLVKVTNAETHCFDLPQDDVDPTGGGGAATGRIAIKVNGATRYIPYFA